MHTLQRQALSISEPTEDYSKGVKPVAVKVSWMIMH